MKEQEYLDPRPREFFDRYHERSRTQEPNWVYMAVKMVVVPYMLIFHRLRGTGRENIPVSGPAIIAPNHFSFLDHFLVARFTKRRVRFMAKSQIFKPPMVWIFSPGGVFPIRRGHRDEEAMLTARMILENGGLVVLYPEAGRSRTREVTNMAKPGIGRLALETGVPIIPTAIIGSEGVRDWKKLRFPRVQVSFGEPVQYNRAAAPSRQQQQEIADEVLTLVNQLFRQGRQ